MLEIFKLAGSVFVDTDAAEKSLASTDKKAEGVGSKLASGIKTAGKWGAALASAAATAATAVAGLTTKSVEAYSEYEQLKGGVETLFGAGGQSIEEYAESVGKTVKEVETEYNDLMTAQTTVLDNAANAYATAGMSANEYMDTVTSFSASLISSLDGDTVKAAEIADRAIVDMSDNANKMGTDISSIQNAYQGFAKGNYTMLDNLKLGYGGTTEEMKRLISEAANMTDAQKELGVTVDATDMSFANIANAISVVQTNMGIAGTTSNEAATTIQGSISSMQSAYENLLTGLADPEQDLGQLIDNLLTTATTALGNITTRIQEILPRISEGLTALMAKVTEILPPLINDLLPPLLTAAIELVNGLVAAAPQLVSIIIGILPQLIEGVIHIAQGILEVLPDLIQTIIEGLLEAAPLLLNGALELFASLITAFEEILPILVDALPELITTILPVIINMIPTLLEGAIELFTAIIEAIPEIIPELTAALPDIIDTILDVLFDSIPILLEGGIDLFTGIIDAIPEIIPDLISSCGDIISTIKDNLVEKAKEALHFTWSLPDVKLPHFTVSPEGWKIGDLLKGSIPSLGISWYAKGGVFEEPSLFYGNGTLNGLGEAGAEAVVPLEQNEKWISKVAQDMTSAVGGTSTDDITTRLDDILTALEQLLGAGIYLDTGAMVGALARPIDKKLGQFAAQKARA